jgi:hypothetical protein
MTLRHIKFILQSSHGSLAPLNFDQGDLVMTNPPASFFISFSIRDIVNKNKYWATHLPEDRMGGMGGAARGVGAGRGAIGAGDSAVRSRTESFTFAIGSCNSREFDTARFIDSLQADVEAEIKGGALAITASDKFGEAGFSFDYAQADLHGRVDIFGRRSLDNNSYRISATLEENGPAVSKQPWMRRNAHPPQGDYYVVTFPDDDIRAHSQRFYYRGKEALDSSVERIRRLAMRDPSNSDALVKSLDHAEVYIWRRMDPEIKERMGAIAHQFELPAEYGQHSVVYFLNQTALRMYREAGEEFEVLKIVSEGEMPNIRGPQLRGPYLPQES